MKIITNYKVLQAQSIEALEDLVKKYLAKGWKPQGGICESGDENFLFFQAMVEVIES